MGRRKLVALALGLIAIGLAPVVPGTSAACVLAPHLADWTVSQGVGSYAPLAQGKEAGVRLYLTLPSCAARKDQIQLVGASLSVTGGTPGVIATPTPPVGTVPPTIGPLPAVDDSPSNPYFVVPGSLLARQDGAAFTAGFTATVSYRAKAATAATFGAIETVTLPATGTPAVTAPVARRSNGLRVLVVPMGDLSQGYDAEFPPLAVSTTQNAMKNLARQLPVNGEVGDLVDGAGAGLRYRINPGMLDLGPDGLGVMARGGQYCGSGASWTAVKSQLSSFLQAWNTANPTAAADRVLGAIWQDNAVSVTAGAGCDEGIATINGREAWFRVSETMAGAVAGMEVLHTLGGAVGTHADFGYHSKNIDADLTDPGRAFNLLLHRYLADARSTMRLSDSLWTQSNTVFEPADYELARCRFDDVPTGGAPCPIGAEVGQPVSAGNVFGISGTVGASGTPVDLHSYFIPGSVERTEADATSRFEVVQLRANGSTIVQRDRIPARTLGTAHEPGHSDDHAHEGDVVIDASVPANTSAEIFEVRRDGVSIYRRVRGAAPTLAVTTGTGASAARSWTADPSQPDAAPALSPDGSMLAWIDGAGIRVRDVAKALTASTAIAGTSPSLSSTSLAFVRDGDIYTAPVTVGGGAVSVGSPTLVYLAAAQVLPLPKATAVTWGAGGRLLASIGGDIFEITPSLLPGTTVTCTLGSLLPLGCVPVAATANVEETNPAASPAGVVAHERDGRIWVGGIDTGIAGSDPAWAGSLLTFVTGGSISAVPANQLGATPKVLLTGDQPAADGAGKLLALHRADGEVWLADLGDDGDLTIVAQDAEPGQLRVDVFLLCNGSVPPVVVAAKPDSVDGGTATFRVTIDTAPACAGSKARVRVTDGWLWTTQDTGPYGDQGLPIPAIAAPLNDDVLRQWDSIPVSGSAVDESSSTTLSWTLVLPNGSTRSLGTGQTLQDLAPPSGGWPTGTYKLRLTATDEAGNAASTEVAFRIVADSDNDGMTNAEEDAATCFSSSRNSDPTNAFDDNDKDGIVNVDDPKPCASAVNVTTDFEPNTLNLGSTGVPVTVRLSATASSGPMSAVDPTTVRITRIGGKEMSLPAQSWSVTGGVGTAQFDRLSVNNAVRSLGVTSGYVAIVVSATAGTKQLHGVDPTAPVVNNS